VRVGVVTFPGSLDDGDAARAVRLAGAEPVRLWHADADLHGVEAVVLPGGFSYGDYLRCGAIARFAPVMTSIVEAAGRGTPVLGICNGFQVLCESHLLPGALVRNDHQRFVCRDEDTLDRLEGEGRVVFRYLQGNPNGSRRDIAGVSDASGRVVGLMPHPEHAVERGFGPTTDGLTVFTSVVASALQGVLA
jgi:phosphoribosylformylglycinamidine (FGAM) synthase-like amidotransferase family enzyme